MSENFEPMITFLMCSRRLENPDSNIIEFFNSATDKLTDEQKERVEFLIKFDTDDTDSHNAILNRNWKTDKLHQPGKYAQTNKLKELPFRIKHFVYNRAEGRRSLHNDYMFLFSQRDPRSKFISFVTDDCVLLADGMFTELERLKDKDWVFMGDKEPDVKKYVNYRANQDWRMDVSMFPIVSTKIIECVQNMGWQVNVDNWITLLHVILYHKYGLDFWKGSYTQYVGRRGGASRESQYGKKYNPFEVNNRFVVENQYYFDLVEQQARNIFLNYQVPHLKELGKSLREL